MNGRVRPRECSEGGSTVCKSWAAWAAAVLLSGLGPPCRWEYNFLYILTITNADKRTQVHVPLLEPGKGSLPQLKEGGRGTHLSTRV